MLKRLFVVLALMLPASALAQSSPELYYGFVPTAAQLNSYFAAKQDVLGYAPLNKSGDVMTGKLTLNASSAGSASLNVPPGSAPTTPVNGDMWSTSAGLFVRAAGATIGPLVGSGSGSIACAQLPALTGDASTSAGSCVTTVARATTISMSGQLTSTLPTGTSPFVVASTTNVANLNASSIGGATFAAPGAIGGTTPSTIAATTLTAASLATASGSLQLLPAATGVGIGGAPTFDTAPFTEDKILQIISTTAGAIKFTNSGNNGANRGFIIGLNGVSAVVGNAEAGPVSFYAGNFEQVRVLNAASATNYMTITGSNGGAPAISTSGGNLTLNSNGGYLLLNFANGTLGNGSVASVFTPVSGPTGAHTAIQGWFALYDSTTTLRYVPFW